MERDGDTCGYFPLKLLPIHARTKKKEDILKSPQKSDNLPLSLYVELCLGQYTVCKFIGRVDFFPYLRTFPFSYQSHPHKSNKTFLI